MHTSFLMIALTTVLSQTELVKTPQWERDYGQALKLAAAKHKPLALVVGSGEKGWEKLGKDGDGLSKEARKLLATEYICTYVDTSTATGKQLAEALEVYRPTGLVISDRTGSVMAFHYQGALASKDLETYLRRYAEPGRVVQTTETNPSQRTSYYQSPTAPAYQPAIQYQQYYQPAMSGRSC